MLSGSDYLQKRIGLGDLPKYIMVGNPRISPDSQRICFTVTRTNLEENTYESNLWLINRIAREAFQLTFGGNDTSPVWSPDGRSIAFTSRRTLKNDERGGELYVINVNGGEARLLLKMSGGIYNIRWSPNGQAILFLSDVPRKQEKGEARVVRGLPVYFDARASAGFVYNLRRHLFVLDIASGEVKQLTKGPIDVLCGYFSNKSDRIAYVSDKGRLRRFGCWETDIYIIPALGGKPKKITKSNMRIGALMTGMILWGPDDKHLAFQGNNLKRGYAGHDNIYVISTDGRKLRNLTESLDRSCQLAFYCDVAGPFIPCGPAWQDQYIYFLVSDEGRVNIYRVHHRGGEVEKVIYGDFSIANFSVAKEVIAFSRVSPTEPTEIWVKEGDNVTPLTKFNDWIRDYRLVDPERFQFTASDGVDVEGWIMKPLDFDEGKKYPMILHIHGGPKTSFGYGYMHEFQSLAAEGYAVVYANPRGSGGYSEEFADIRQHYGEKDYQDIMEAVDYVISEYVYLDHQMMGVTGLSYGGFMTNWIVTHTNRFKAAVTQASICNRISFFGTSDIGFHHSQDEMGGDPWTIEEKYLKNSPLRYVKNVKTPTMVMHSFEDYRCPLEQGLQFYTALQYLGKESELVLFKGIHSLFIAGEPRTRIERLKHIVRWFDRFLKE
jgi:dipeptidyl aminopeptidase/acylaminoacyl peptidase